MIILQKQIRLHVTIYATMLSHTRANECKGREFERK